MADNKSKQSLKPQSNKNNHIEKKQGTTSVGTKKNIGNVDESTLKVQWKKIRDVAKSISPETGALLNSCRTFTMRRGRLVLGFSSPILQSKMENGQNILHAKNKI